MAIERGGNRRLDATRSLSVRLGVTVAIGILITSMLVTTGVIWRAFEQEVEDRSLEIQTMAQVLASSISEAVSVEDRVRILETIRTISYSDRITFASVVTLDGRRLAQAGYQTALIPDKVQVDWTSRLRRFLNPAGIIESVDIRHSGAVVGTLRLGGQTRGAKGPLIVELKNATWWALFAILIGLVIAYLMQRRITRPINKLTDVMAEVTPAGNLPPSLDVDARGEVRILIDSYNTMIEQITNRDAVIAKHQDHLEQTVDERTRDLRIARDQAEQAAEAKSRFLATMSHEIRTPMSGVLVMAELLARSDLRSEQKAFADVIARSGQALMSLLNDVLDISKLDAEHATLEKIAVPIDELVNDVVMLFWEQARSRGIELVARVDANVPAEVTCDPTRLRQCLANLIGNALKFTEIGHVSVEVTHDGLGMLRIAVRDTGVGIPKDRQDAIFNVFEQADNSTMRNYGGTGLGLAIVSRLVEAMDGEVKLESEVGMGSTFELLIPINKPTPLRQLVSPIEVRLALVGNDSPELHRALGKMLNERGAVLVSLEDAPDCVLADLITVSDIETNVPVVGLWPLGMSEPREALETQMLADVLPIPCMREAIDELLERIATKDYRGLAALETVENTVDDADYSSLRVLVVDDGEVNLQVFEDALASFSIAPNLVASGDEALTQVQNQTYDLIFIDKNMPGKDGFETARQVRAIESAQGRERASLFLITASLANEYEDDLEEAGFDGFLPKPFKLSELQRLLAACIDCYGSGERHIPAKEEDRTLPRSDDIFDEAVLTELRSLDAKRPGAMARVLDIFLETAPGAVRELVSALRQDEPELARKAAHALKSISGSVGANRIAEFSADLETRAVEAAALASKFTATEPEIEELNQLLTDAETAVHALIKDACRLVG